MTHLKSIYLTKRFFAICLTISIFFVIGHFLPLFFVIAKTSLLIFLAFILFDLIMLYNHNHNILAIRSSPEKLSNGDDNEIRLTIKNKFPFLIHLQIIDEIPFQFQIRNFLIQSKLQAEEEKNFLYKLKPLQRGEYHFGSIHLYVSTNISLIIRRFTFKQEETIPVYPSFLQMRKYELLAISDHLNEYGIKKIRKTGHYHEFDHIREYVTGDDYRSLNWKATARKSKLMVNQFQDERSQQIYSIIDMGRVMKMPFEGMTLLDYAINSSLVISNIAIQKNDKVGLITYTQKINSFIPADRKNNTIMKIMEVLYNQSTDFFESNIELLYVTIKRTIKHRSLLIFYTNFESRESLNRYIQYYQNLSKLHLVLVIIFENTEIKKSLKNPTISIEDIYEKTIAENYFYDKKLIIKELNQKGIQTVYTKPQLLSVNLINKYLELKSRGLI